jgi:hypothetical protein
VRQRVFSGPNPLDAREPRSAYAGSKLDAGVGNGRANALRGDNPTGKLLLEPRNRGFIYMREHIAAAAADDAGIIDALQHVDSVLHRFGGGMNSTKYDFHNGFYTI